MNHRLGLCVDNSEIEYTDASENLHCRLHLVFSQSKQASMWGTCARRGIRRFANQIECNGLEFPQQDTDGVTA